MSVMFGWNWTEVSVFGSHIFGQASMEGCGYLNSFCKGITTEVRLGILMRNQVKNKIYPQKITHMGDIETFDVCRYKHQYQRKPQNLYL